MTSPSLRLTREDLRVIYTPGRGVTIYRKFSWLTVWTRVAWFLSPESAECYLPRGWEDWPTLLADFAALRAERVAS